MCFGSTQTSQTDLSRTMPAWLTGQAQANIANANQLAGQAYVGQQVAGLTPDQQTAYGMVRNIAGTGNPYLAQIQKAYGRYGSAPASTISAPSVLGGGVDAAKASLSDYMDPNIKAELDPTLAEIERERQMAVAGPGGIGSQATGQGGADAFGDSRAGVATAGTNAAALRAGATATGQAYQNAFTNAANLRGIDLSNMINTQTTNAGLNEQQLARVFGSGNALQGLDLSQLQRGLTGANALNATGQQQQQYDQAVANLPWLNNQGRQQFELAGLQGQNAATATATPAAGYNQTSTTYQPNNSGWALAGSLGGSILGNMIMPGFGGAVGGGLGSILGSAGGGAGNGWGNNMFGGDIYANVAPQANGGIGHA